MVDVYQNHLTNSMSELSPEQQLSEYSEYMKTLAFVGLFGLVFGNIRDFMMQRMKKMVGRNVHKETLR